MPPREETPFRRFVADFAESRLAVLGLVVFVLIVLCAIFAPWISPQDPYDLAQLDIMDGRLPPGSQSADGMTFWLGTDDQGRDMLSGIMYGLAHLALRRRRVGAARRRRRLGARADRRLCRRLARDADHAAASTCSSASRSILVALMILAFLGKGDR